jgi:hypothetical protein
LRSWPYIGGSAPLTFATVIVLFAVVRELGR